jgi:hypothetical protein
MGVADDGKVHTAQRAGLFPISIFHRFASGKLLD